VEALEGRNSKVETRSEASAGLRFIRPATDHSDAPLAPRFLPSLRPALFSGEGISPARVKHTRLSGEGPPIRSVPRARGADGEGEEPAEAAADAAAAAARVAAPPPQRVPRPRPPDPRSYSPASPPFPSVSPTLPSPGAPRGRAIKPSRGVEWYGGFLRFVVGCCFVPALGPPQKLAAW
jgi:hypothetical protein